MPKKVAKRSKPVTPSKAAKPPKVKNIIVLSAHSDDEALGCGGAIAKYAKDGYAVHTIICSFGELSHPHLRPEVIRKIRVKEAQRADKILGGSGVSFLGLKEGSFLADAEKDNSRIRKNLQKRIKELKPEKLFTHSSADSHPDHQATYELAKRMQKYVKFELYTYHIWTLINKRQGKTPILYIDITDVFGKKIAALHEFKSQIHPLGLGQMNNVLYLFVYLKAIFAGVRRGNRYAETFHYEAANND